MRVSAPFAIKILEPLFNSVGSTEVHVAFFF